MWFGAGVSSVMSAAAATTRLSSPQSADQAGLLMSISGFELPLFCQSRSFVAKDGPGYLCVNSSGDPKIPLSTTIPHYASSEVELGLKSFWLPLPASSALYH